MNWSYVTYLIETTRTDFYKFDQNRNGVESNNVVSALNKTVAEFNTLFRPIPKPKPKTNNAERITYVGLCKYMYNYVQGAAKK